MCPHYGASCPIFEKQCSRATQFVSFNQSSRERGVMAQGQVQLGRANHGMRGRVRPHLLVQWCHKTFSLKENSWNHHS